MAEILNNTPSHQVFSLMGEVSVSKTYKTVIPGKNGEPPEVVPHTVAEVRTKPVKTVIVPPNVRKDGLDGVLTLDKDELKQLKSQPEFMAAVTNRTITITNHN